MTFLSAILSRLISTAITLIGAAVVVLFVIRVVPGNPIAMMLPPGATEADIARLQALYGFDKPIWQQFLIWVSGVLHGDFGTSISLRQPVLDLVLGRLPATLEHRQRQREQDGPQPFTAGHPAVRQPGAQGQREQQCRHQQRLHHQQ